MDLNAPPPQQEQSTLPEQSKQAIDIAYRAQGFVQYLHAQGAIGRGNEVREAIASLLALETTAYPEHILAARMEVAEALQALLDQHQYDSGERKYTSVPQDAVREDELGKAKGGWGW